MPTVGESANSKVETAAAAAAAAEDDFASTDEVKVYKDEGDDDENRSSENLSEDKFGLVIETEQGRRGSDDNGNSYTEDDGTFSLKNQAKLLDYRFPEQFLFGYPFLPTYPYANGAGLTGPGKLIASHPGLSLYMYNNDTVAQPPPAHTGILPLHVDPKTGLPRPSIYGLPTSGRISGSELNALHSSFDLMAQTSAAAAAAAAAVGLFNSPLSSSALSSWFGSNPPSSATQGPLMTLQDTVAVNKVSAFGPVQDLSLPTPSIDMSRALQSHRHRTHNHHSVRDGIDHQFNSICPPNVDGCHSASSSAQRRSMIGGGVSVPPQSMMSSGWVTTARGLPEQLTKRVDGGGRQSRPHIKKPLNAFMIFMKEMRQSVINECTLKESAAINQILGRRWHALDRNEQAKYYDMARKEKELHMQLYPGWSARDNYATHAKKKKLKGGDTLPRTAADLERVTSSDQACQNIPKCRSLYGFEQQHMWCKVCRFDCDNSSTENTLVPSPFPLLADAVESSYRSSLSASPR